MKKNKLLGVAVALVLGHTAVWSDNIPKGLLGMWTLDMDSGEPAYIRLVEEEGENLAYMRVYVGSEGPYKIKEVKEGRVRFEMRRGPNKKKNRPAVISAVDVGLENGVLQGKLVRSEEGNDVLLGGSTFRGKKVPPMPEQAPDLSKIRFGQPISLFNGVDLTGWRAYEPDKLFGWGVEEGLLVNNTPKTDFSATGAYANLRTEADFEDFNLHIEFLIEANRNSGVYLRGMYEAQVVDRDSRMQGLQGVGAIFSRIAPSVNAGREPGEWQTYDLTLVDRHVTVVLNGVKVIDNQPVIGPTGGAINTDPMAAGPIYLQGDHTAVKYRDIYLAPLIKD